MDFNLHQHIRRILADTTDENLNSLTDIVFASIPNAALRDALHQALPEVVRRELATSPRLGQKEPETHALNTEAGTNSVGNLRNSRTAIFRRNRFRVSVWIGGGNYRQLLDCTREDLEFAAAESDRQAKANEATAERYRRLTKKLIECGADKVADLTDDEIEEALRDE